MNDNDVAYNIKAHISEIGYENGLLCLGRLLRYGLIANGNSLEILESSILLIKQVCALSLRYNLLLKRHHMIAL